MSCRAAILAMLCCAGLVALALAQDAAGDVFGPIQLTSSREVQNGASAFSEQAEQATEPAIAGDGRYVAFVGSFGGVPGIWRRDLQSGVVEQVAPTASAVMPSISADGQYVSFTTTARLAPEDDRNNAPDVYVRDMAKPCAGEGGSCAACDETQDAAEREACPFVLVSAVNGSSEGATYRYADAVEEEARYGSLASGRSAMSADGRYVVFETGAESNLLGSTTPAREILLRDLDTDQTTLVSAEYDPQTGADTGVPVPIGEGVGAAYEVPDFGHSSFGGASISADGSTVAWLGQSVARQARLLSAEQNEYSPKYDEPLWRRVNEGPSAPTRRVSGGSDPENPLCEASGEALLPLTANPLDPCQGPFALSGLPEFLLLDASDGNYVPQLSADGDTVAFLASAREVAAGEELLNTEGDDDLYISQMTRGLTRVQALQRLTEIAGEVTKAELAAPIVDLAISADGKQVAFTTQRTEFPLGSRSYVSPVAARAGVKELFDADLANETLTRVTHGFSGEATPSEVGGGGGSSDGAASPSFSENGDVLSFASDADNLVYGDGNGASDAFLVNRVLFAEDPPPQYISSPPAQPALSPPWRIYATADANANATVTITATVPGEGRLAAAARTPVRVRVHAHGAARAHITLATRTVSSAHAQVAASTGGQQKLTLTLGAAYRALAQRSAGLQATVTLTFAAPAHPDLHATLRVRFRRATPKKKGRSR